MAKQLLIYERAVSVSAQRHRDWSVATGRSYAFARGINAAPLVAAGADFLAVSGAVWNHPAGPRAGVAAFADVLASNPPPPRA